MQLDELKIRLKKMIAEEGLAASLSALKEVLPEQSERFEDVLLIESRQNEANRQRLRNLISNEDLQITYARIREDLMSLIDQLQPKDFEKTSVDEQKIKGKKVKKGSILHRIPGQMQLKEETKCIVRIALDEEVIIQSIDLDEEVVLKSIRVSDIMQVELIDPSNEHPFTIKAINSAEQFVEEDDYTEWVFFVTPLMEGTFPLLLKVAVIELIHGKERKREIVLEERIRILTQAAGKAKASFKDAGYQLAFGSEAVFPSENQGLEEENFKKVKQDPQISTLENYLKKYPERKHLPSVQAKIREIEKESFESLKLDPSRIKLETYLQIFPDGSYAEKVKKLINTIERVSIGEQTSDQEERLWQKILKDNQEADLLSYIKNYPQGRYAKEAQKRLANLRAARDISMLKDASKKDLEEILKRHPDSDAKPLIKTRIQRLGKKNE
jgi:hypothetical protein